MRIYWLDCLDKGNLGMMARPKGNDWLEDEILKLKNKKVNSIISLLEKSEIIELGLLREEELCQQHHIEFLHFPIADRNVPQNLQHFKSFVEQIITHLQQDKTLVVHCRMGIGRTSLLIASILKYQQSKSAGEIFNYLSEIRTLNVPDTNKQVEWVNNLSFIE